MSSQPSLQTPQFSVQTPPLNVQYASIIMMVYRQLIVLLVLAGLFMFGTMPRTSGLVPEALKKHVLGGGKTLRG